MSNVPQEISQQALVFFQRSFLLAQDGGYLVNIVPQGVQLPFPLGADVQYLAAGVDAGEILREPVDLPGTADTEPGGQRKAGPAAQSGSEGRAGAEKKRARRCERGAGQQQLQQKLLCLPAPHGFSSHR